jgi:hypothetical protein
MATSSRRLLHLLISDDSAKALPIALEQQRRGVGRPLLVLGPAAAGLTVPAGLETARLSSQIDDGALLALIYEAESVSVW